MCYEAQLVFPSVKSGREISLEICFFLKFPVSREIYAGISGIFLYLQGFYRDTDIHHSDIKNALVQILNVFLWSLKIIFQNSQNFLRRSAYEIKLFFSIFRKN